MLTVNDLNARQRAFVELITQTYGQVDTIDRAQVLHIMENHNVTMPSWLVNDPELRVGRGIYRVPTSNAGNTVSKNTIRTKSKVATLNTTPVATAPVAMADASMDLTAPTEVKVHAISLVPEKARGYVKFGHFEDVHAIVSSARFYPIFITGLSGNGKTMMVEQACAVAKREMFRVNITIETDEDDLIGGFRLINGQTVWHNGPVISAMERGAVLLLDEVDLASNKIMCLQPVLEGKPIYLKKINKLVHPAPGFTIIATANTKGRGSDDGKFIGTNVLNEAFLERFSITMEQEYATMATEKKMLVSVLENAQASDDNFAEMLVRWADIIRKSYYEGAVAEIISTRRLVHICEAFGIFNKNRMKAIGLCLNRFDGETKAAFLDLYTKVDAEVNPPAQVPTANTANTDSVATSTATDEVKVEF